MARTLRDFAFAAFYYPEMMAAALALKAVDWPEHTETDDHDPVIQTLSIYCHLAHGGAARLDHTARETYWPSLQLRSSAIAQAALMDYRLAPASPATVDVLADVGAVGPGDRLLRARSLVGTGAREEVQLVYEYMSDTDLYAEMGVADWYILVGDDDAGTVEEIDDIATLSWALTAPDENGSRWIAFGNADLEFNKIRIPLGGPGGELAGRWEYNDDLREMSPDEVTDNGDGTITLDVTTLVGNEYSVSTGLLVTVTCLRTGITETRTTSSTGIGGVETITTATTLGQVSISEEVADYLVTTAWVELEGLVDGTIRSDGVPGGTFDVEGDVTWDLPEATDRRWGRLGIEVDTGAYAGETRTAHWVRFRFQSGDTSHTQTWSGSLAEARATTWTLRWEATQGRRVVESKGESDGTANQRFTLVAEPFLSLESVTVNGVEWTQRDNFLTAGPFDRVFKLLEQPDGTWRLQFGDGARGKIPPEGEVIVVTFRIGGAANGNVGPGSIVRDRTGNRLQAVRNPRAASGWVAAEGSTATSLEEVREAVPASLRAATRVVTPEDGQALAVAYRTDDAEQLVVRALAVEEGAGPKTMLIYCVGPDGTAPSVADLAELEEYFNGETIGIQRIGGVGLANTEISCAAFTAVPFDITATVEILETYADGAEAAIVAALESVLQPTARRLLLNEDGVWEESSQYLWGWGSTVSRAQLIARIVSAVGGVVNLTLTTPAGDTALGDGELPVPGTIAITVTPVPV